MKKILFFIMIAAVAIGCTNHKTKYDNGQVDEYTYKDDMLEIKIPNGDNSEGTIRLRVTKEDLESIYSYKYFQNWQKTYKGKSELDGVVRYVKTTAIDARYQTLANPTTAKFNGQSGTIAVNENGDLWLFYDIIAKNGFGVEGNVPVTISLGKDADEPVIM